MEEFHKNSLKHPQWNFGAQQTDQIFPTGVFAKFEKIVLKRCP